MVEVDPVLFSRGLGFGFKSLLWHHLLHLVPKRLWNRCKVLWCEVSCHTWCSCRSKLACVSELSTIFRRFEGSFALQGHLRPCSIECPLGFNLLLGCTLIASYAVLSAHVHMVEVDPVLFSRGLGFGFKSLL